jgi:hypothetical protein
MNAYEANLESTNATLRSRFESHGPLLIAGLQARYTFGTLDDIPRQWERFVPQIASVRGRVGEAAYGLCLNMSAGNELATSNSGSRSKREPMSTCKTRHRTGDTP